MQIPFELSVYASMLAYHLYNGGRTYRPTNHTIVQIHTAASILELLRYHLPTAKQQADGPGLFELALCFIQSGTNLFLVRKLRKGNPGIVRPTYQAGALFRPFLILLALFHPSQRTRAASYSGSVSSLHAFVWTRALIFVLSTGLPEKDFRAAVNRPEIYTCSVLGGALIATALGGGIVPYVGTVMLVMQISKVVSARTRFPDPSAHTYRISAFLARLGFSDLATLDHVLRIAPQTVCSPYLSRDDVPPTIPSSMDSGSVSLPTSPLTPPLSRNISPYHPTLQTLQQTRVPVIGLLPGDAFGAWVAGWAERLAADRQLA